MLKIGDRVYLTKQGDAVWNRGSLFGLQSNLYLDPNPVGVEGTIVESDITWISDLGEEPFKYRVAWDNGSFNAYREGDISTENEFADDATQL